MAAPEDLEPEEPTDEVGEDEEPDDDWYERAWERSHPPAPQPYYDGGRLVRPHW